MKIQFDSKKIITIVKAQTKDFTEIEVMQVTDFNERKKVVANIKDIGQVVLWEGADYDAIGQWTDTDVVNKLKEIYG